MPDGIIRVCKDQLAGYKCPKEIFFHRSIPKKSYGKIAEEFSIAILKSFAPVLDRIGG
jgi:hypothetical protein